MICEFHQAACTDTRREPRNQLAREILENLARFPQCILLTRVGQFYEVRTVNGFCLLLAKSSHSLTLIRRKRLRASFLSN